MKKWSIGLLVFCFLLWASIYLFIPSVLNVAHTAAIHCTINGANRYLLDESNWMRWWPGTRNRNPEVVRTSRPSFKYKGYSFQVSELLYNRVRVHITNHKGLQTIATINIIDTKDALVSIRWECRVTTGLNPVKRIQQFRFAKDLDKKLPQIMEGLKTFLDKPENIYGIGIEKVRITDTLMVASRSISSTYPGPIEIHALINRLKAYIKSQSAHEAGYPMVNVDSGNHGYVLMIAIPTDRRLEGEGDILFKGMPAVHILVTEVRGGPAAVRNALKEMKNFMQDYGIASPAIPFESLVTDRLNEPDTNKWVTRVYHPAYYGKD